MQDFAPILDGVTFINPIGLTFTLLMGVLLVALPRKYALLPIIVLTCYMTIGMRLVVGGMNFTMLRVLLLFGWARLVLRREFRPIRLNSIDKAQLLYVAVSFIAYCLLWQNYDAFKNRLGFVYNTIGFYFLFRFLLRDVDDIVRVFKLTAVFMAPLAAMMVMEKFTGRNVFSVFGGVPEFTFIRNGTLRCEGPFAHPILAGTFGATLMPYFAGLWKRGRSFQMLCILGFLSAIVITLTSGSSGPVLSFLCGILALGLWRYRKHMRKIRWGLVLSLIILHLAMKAPVWFVLAKVDVFNGSTGYHRAYLIDRAIANLGEWWLLGSKSTAGWADADQHLFDVTNQYLVEGANAGLLAMILFISVIVFAFRRVGIGTRALMARDGVRGGTLAWALGAALLAHTVTYISVSYFDQNFVNWYLLLAMISVLPTAASVRKPVPKLVLSDERTYPMSHGDLGESPA